MTQDPANPTPPDWMRQAVDLADGLNPVVLITSEAAALLRIDPRHLRRLVRAQRVPHIRLGRELRFRRESLLTWLRDREVPVKDIGDRRRRKGQPR